MDTTPHNMWMAKPRSFMWTSPLKSRETKGIPSLLDGGKEF